MVRNDIKNSSLLKTKFLIYAFNGRTRKKKVNTPFMYEVLNKDTMKNEILPHLSVEKRGYVSKR